MRAFFSEQWAYARLAGATLVCLISGHVVAQELGGTPHCLRCGAPGVPPRPDTW